MHNLLVILISYERIICSPKSAENTLIVSKTPTPTRGATCKIQQLKTSKPTVIKNHPTPIGSLYPLALCIKNCPSQSRMDNYNNRSCVQTNKHNYCLSANQLSSRVCTCAVLSLSPIYFNRRGARVPTWVVIFEIAIYRHIIPTSSSPRLIFPRPGATGPRHGARARPAAAHRELANLCEAVFLHIHRISGVVLSRSLPRAHLHNAHARGCGILRWDLWDVRALMGSPMTDMVSSWKLGFWLRGPGPHRKVHISRCVQ